MCGSVHRRAAPVVSLSVNISSSLSSYPSSASRRSPSSVSCGGDFVNNPESTDNRDPPTPHRRAKTPCIASCVVAPAPACRTRSRGEARAARPPATCGDYREGKRPPPAASPDSSKRCTSQPCGAPEPSRLRAAPAVSVAAAALVQRAGSGSTHTPEGEALHAQPGTRCSFCFRKLKKKRVSISSPRLLPRVHSGCRLLCAAATLQRLNCVHRRAMRR